MSHTTKDKQDLVSRIRRIKGQLEAVERQLENEDHDPYEVLQTLTACRGAMHGLVASIIEGHIRHHVVNPDAVSSAAQTEAVEQLIEIIKTYLK
jgi:DNA-binding FrmR family transcriptional regulator